MKTVWKFQIKVENYIEINLPVGAKPLSVQSQGESVYLWCLCDDDEKEYEVRKFRLTGTGHPIEEGSLRFIGTFQLFSGDFVGHLFEIN